MSLIVDVAADGVRLPLSRARLAAAARVVLRAERVKHAFLSLAFVSPRRIASLNRKHRGHAAFTDVLAFGFQRQSRSDPVIGDVYIAPAVGRRSAREAGVSFREELVRLVIHGTLHVLGYDHPEEGDRTTSPMWKKQERLVKIAMRAATRR